MKAAVVRLGPFFLRYFRHYVAWAILAVLTVLTYAAATGAMVALIGPIFDEVLLAGDQAPRILGTGGTPRQQEVRGEEAGEPPRTALQRIGDRLARKLDVEHKLKRSYQSLRRRLGIGDEDIVFFLPALFVVVFLIRSLSDFASGYSFQRIGLGITTDIRNDLYRDILHQSSRFYIEHPSGELVSRVVSDVGVMQNAVSNRLLDLFQQSFTLLVLLWMLLATHFRLALICLVATPLFLFPIFRFGKGMRRTSHRSQERMADLAQLLSEGVRGNRVVKAFGMEDFEYRRFWEATRRHLRVNLRAQMLSHGSGPVVESMAALGCAALVVYAGFQIRRGELSPPELVQFLLNLLLLYDPIRKLNKVNLILQEALAAAQRVSSLMAIPNEVVDRPRAAPIHTVSERVAFEGVTFGYEDQEVLRDIDLAIRRGEIVALVGPSGAGKSTLVNLLPRFFDPDRGRVSIDGIDVRDLPIRNLRSLVGIVTQETLLFNDTVRNNIAYGRSDLPLERVRESAAAAYADEFITELPEGYDTVIGESGLRLSGGQRQRLAIARALLKNAPILILDEATSQLDTESEALVQKALYNLMEGRTTLVIAHRLSTVMRADRIVVLTAGRIVEEGSHDQLLALGGTYKRLYDLQFQA